MYLLPTNLLMYLLLLPTHLLNYLFTYLLPPTRYLLHTYLTTYLPTYLTFISYKVLAKLPSTYLVIT